MKRIDTALRAGVAFAALVAANSAAEAQSTLPPPDVAASPRHRHRKNRARRTTSSSPGRASAAILSTSMRRVCSSTRPTSQKTGLNSINDVLQRLPSSGGGLNSKFNNSGNLGNPPDGGGVGAGVGGSRSSLSRLAPRARARRRPALCERRIGERRAGIDRPQLHPRKRDRARSKCCRTARRPSTVRTRSRAW